MATSIVIDNLPGKVRVCVTDATGRFDVAEFERGPGGAVVDQGFCDWINRLDKLVYDNKVPAVSVYPDPADYAAPVHTATEGDRLLPSTQSRPSGSGGNTDRIPD
jgi:hypothetical protein